MHSEQNHSKMKNLLFTLIALVAFTSIVGCKKDKDDDMDTKSEFTYDGTTYSLANGYIDDFGSNGNGSFDWDVIITSSSITVDSVGDFSGMGDLVYLDLNSSDSTGLVAGTYNWSTTREISSIVDGSIGIDLDLATLMGTNISASAGTVDVAINGTETTITFNLTFADGKTVSGEWKGVLEDI